MPSVLGRVLPVFVSAGLTLGVLDALHAALRPAHLDLDLQGGVLLCGSLVALFGAVGLVAGLVALLPALVLRRPAAPAWAALARRPATAVGAGLAVAALLHGLAVWAGDPLAAARLLALALLAAAIPGAALDAAQADRRSAVRLARTRSGSRWRIGWAAAALVFAVAALLPFRDPEVRLQAMRRAPAGSLALGLLGGGGAQGSAPDRAGERAAPAPPSSTPSGWFSGRSVVLITVGGLRADRTGAGGSPRMVTPALDLLATRAVVFPEAYAAAPDSPSAALALLTGRRPGRAGAAAPPTLAELVRDTGYRTVAAVGAPWQARGTPLVRGFDEVDDLALQTRNRDGGGVVADVLARRAARLAERVRGHRFLLWVHLPDPTPPHLYHAGAAYFGDEAEDRYDGELAFADAQIGALLDDLERSGLTEGAVVVVAGAHGVGFDPGRAGGLGEDLIRTPLYVWLPDVPARRATAPVRHVDLVPTLLDLLGLPCPAGVDGRSLAPVLLAGSGVTAGQAGPDGGGAAQSHGDDAAVAELRSPGGDDVRAIVSAGWKLVEDRRRGTRELYHLALDPDERTNLLADAPDALVSGLHERLVDRTSGP